jgi:hypothetical protein
MEELWSVCKLMGSSPRAHARAHTHTHTEREDERLHSLPYGQQSHCCDALLRHSQEYK